MLPLRAVCVLLVVGLGVALSSAEEACPDEGGSCKRHIYKQPLGSDAEVSFEQLKQMLASGNVQLFDVREPSEFEEGAIPGAINIPLSEVEQSFTLTPDQFKELYGASVPGKNDPDFIVYCQRGRRSLTALEILYGLGYNRARHYAGGYGEWEKLDAQ
ncbi:thiosulfate sulfurtransferase/rhodanese-like domain-containing protein 1 [Hoplias malabaricus]|uniref:thiosulfate sulfurtransferase/rhodanese-like domain-containing protein 1 n=1 Tax=Hoplias malabaricus TaxID=27720 RepID=UPI0034627134